VIVEWGKVGKGVHYSFPQFCTLIWGDFGSGVFMHYDPLPTSPSEAPCKGKINDRFWGRSNFSLEGDCDFHSNIDSPSPIRDRRMGEGREGGSLLLPPNPHVDLGRPTGLPLCPIGRGAAFAIATCAGQQTPTYGSQGHKINYVITRRVSALPKCTGTV